MRPDQQRVWADPVTGSIVYFLYFFNLFCLVIIHNSSRLFVSLKYFSNSLLALLSSLLHRRRSTITRLDCFLLLHNICFKVHSLFPIGAFISRIIPLTFISARCSPGITERRINSILYPRDSKKFTVLHSCGCK